MGRSGRIAGGSTKPLRFSNFSAMVVKSVASSKQLIVGSVFASLNPVSGIVKPMYGVPV
jgi:hypothetical protein